VGGAGVFIGRQALKADLWLFGVIDEIKAPALAGRFECLGLVKLVWRERSLI